MDKKHLDLARNLGAKIAVPVTFPVMVEGNVLHFPIAKRQAPVGTIHQWGDGHKYRKTPVGWEMVHDTGGNDPGHPTTDKPAPEKVPAPAPAHVVIPAPATPPPAPAPAPAAPTKPEAEPVFGLVNHGKFEMALKPGDEAEARWTNNHTHYRGRVRITKANDGSVRGTLMHHIKDYGLGGHHVGREVTVPKMWGTRKMNSAWSHANGIFPVSAKTPEADAGAMAAHEAQVRANGTAADYKLGDEITLHHPVSDKRWTSWRGGAERHTVVRVDKANNRLGLKAITPGAYSGSVDLTDFPHRVEKHVASATDAARVEVKPEPHVAGNVPAGTTHVTVHSGTGLVHGHHKSEQAAREAGAKFNDYRGNYLSGNRVHVQPAVQDAPKHEPAPQVAPGVAALRPGAEVAQPVPLEQLPPGHLKSGKSEYPPDVERLNSFEKEPVTVKGQHIRRPAMASIFHTHAAVDSATGEVLSTHGGSLGGEVGAAGQARGRMRDTPGRRVHVAPLLQPTEADHEAVAAATRAIADKSASDHKAWLATPEGQAEANWIKGPEQLKPEVEPKPKSVDQGFHDAVVKFAHAVSAERAEHALSNGYIGKVHVRGYTPKVKYGRNYAYVDVGGSGKYMIPHKTPGGKLSHIPVGEVLGIDSAYGVPHPGKRHGNVLADTAKPARH